MKQGKLNPNVTSSHRYEDPFKRFFKIFLGNPLKTSAQHKETLGFILGLPILAVDALSSIAYASEEILLGLSILGASYFSFSVPIAIAIVILILTLVVSYMQTVTAYPNGGGAYTVSRDHLGPRWALIAASSLLIDYVLTVAVSVTAGVRAITSAFPLLAHSSTHISIIIIFILTWINLRGIRESAVAVSFPVYAFIFSMFLLSISGVFIGVATPSIPHAPGVVEDPILNFAALLVVLRAFAGGCTAMTGIEVVANAGSILKKPHDLYARRILMALGSLLAFCFLSVTFTANHIGLTPVANESLISQMTRYLWGNGALHQIVQLTTASVLFLAANSAYAGFPKLAAILAQDGWLPKQFSALGDRLVFSQGILWLAVGAIALVILFKADTHALIPLYAVGVFTAFTLSQSGMVRYWFKEKKAYVKAQEAASDDNVLERPTCRRRVFGYYRRMLINGFGAVVTLLALLVTFEAKFMGGAYIVLIIVPLFSALFISISNHYKDVNAQMSIDSFYIKKRRPMLAQSSSKTIVVPISRLHKGSFEAIAFAREMSKDVRVLLIDPQMNDFEKLVDDVKSLNWELEIVQIKSPYRAVVQPIVEYVHNVDMEKRELAILVLPEIVPAHWWENMLHNQTAKRIAKLLSWNEHIPNKARIVINVPFYLE